uniref:Uncharacterized protein n=1 Tax=Anguilla anguilla TaxID=7936 RepID=A0A0E9PTL5_ANGAN
MKINGHQLLATMDFFIFRMTGNVMVMEICHCHIQY